METPRTLRSRDLVAATLLAVVGVGIRVAFSAAYPTQPFWDFLGLIHFGVLLRDHGLVADGWHWSQFNSGLPVMLSLLFRLIPGDTVRLARSATVVLSGLLPLIPFFLWRSVLRFRWRVLAGALLALWPGQIFFSGVVSQDNWVLLPVVMLGSLAVRRLLGGGHVSPIVGGLLFVWAVSIRQEMVVVLLPVVVAASIPPATRRHRRRALMLLAMTVALGILAIGTQRFMATGRFSATTEHGALGLLGSFMPGASTAGWIDARAYAAALDPGVSQNLFGRQSTLLRITWEEAKRRPVFHLVRIAAWLPRLAADADADDLFWSVGEPESQPLERRADAARFRQRWIPRLKLELSLIQGAFLATLAVGIRRRNLAILTLSSAVLLKFLIHMFVSPIGRLVVPAIALELLAIPLGAAELEVSSPRERLVHAALALGTCGLLFFGVPPLANFVIRHDRAVLPGVRQFTLRVEGGGKARCELTAGAVSGLGPRWASLRTVSDEPAPGERARASCVLRSAVRDEPLIVRLQGFPEQGTARMIERIEVDGREAFRGEVSPGGQEKAVEIGIRETPLHQPTVVIELIAGDASDGRSSRATSLHFRFARRPSSAGSSPR